MNLFDPARPRNPHGQPKLLTGGLVPTWYLIAQSPEKVKVMVFLLTSGINSYRDFSTWIAAGDLAGLWQEWLAGPEEFNALRFNYAGPAKGTTTVGPLPKAMIEETLEDLGL
jgi:hypothetical protein